MKERKRKTDRIVRTVYERGGTAAQLGAGEVVESAKRAEPRRASLGRGGGRILGICSHEH